MYHKHIFICTFERTLNSSRVSCGTGGKKLLGALRQKIIGMGLQDFISINSCNCLDRCEDGPIIVIYPEKIIYKNIMPGELDEIIDETIINNKVIKRLLVTRETQAI